MMGEMSVILNILFTRHPAKAGSRTTGLGLLDSRFRGNDHQPYDLVDSLRGRVSLALVHSDLLRHRPQRDGREKGEPTNDQHDTDKQADKQRPIGRERTCGWGE